MTLEELKAEAEKLGYELRKKKPAAKYVPFLPCLCGGTRHYEWITGEKLPGERNWRVVSFFECSKCGLKSKEYPGKTDNEAREGWNRMIEERMAENAEKG